MAWTETHNRLFKKVSWEMGEYARSMWDRPASEVYDKAEEISAMRICYDQLTENLHDYLAKNLEPLLQCENLLEVLCCRWMSEQDYNPSEKFDRILRSLEYLKEPEPGMGAPDMC